MNWMTLDRALAILGILLGLPGVLVLLLSANQTLAIVIAVLAVLLLGTAYFIKNILNAAPYSMREATVTLRFPTDDQRAVLTKEYRIVPNFGHLKQIEHKNIAADGVIQNICWDDRPVPDNCTIFRLGEYEIKIDLPVQPRRWNEFPGKLSYELVGSFNGSTESILYCVDFPTKKATIIVEFPPNRPCLSAQARKIQGAGEVPLRNPIISADRRRIELQLRRPSLGTHYAIYWTW